MTGLCHTTRRNWTWTQSLLCRTTPFKREHILKSLKISLHVLGRSKLRTLMPSGMWLFRSSYWLHIHGRMKVGKVTNKLHGLIPQEKITFRCNCIHSCVHISNLTFALLIPQHNLCTHAHISLKKNGNIRAKFY